MKSMYAYPTPAPFPRVLTHPSRENPQRALVFTFSPPPFLHLLLDSAHCFWEAALTLGKLYPSMLMGHIQPQIRTPLLHVQWDESLATIRRKDMGPPFIRMAAPTTHLSLTKIR